MLSIFYMMTFQKRICFFKRCVKSCLVFNFSMNQNSAEAHAMCTAVMHSGEGNSVHSHM